MSILTPAPDTTPSKPVFQSKTVIVNLIIALGSAIPQVGQLVSDHPQAVLLGVTLINLALRWVTKNRVTLFGGE
jgi:hypothetical protein